MAKINYKSDFDFILTLRDAQGNDIGFPDFDWEARFWTFSPMQSVTASCRGGKCVNCFNDNGKIHVVLNAPALGCGRLHAEVVTHRADDIYPDGERTLYTPDILDIELVNDKGDEEMTASAEIVVPSVGAKALPRIEVEVWQDRWVEGKDAINGGRTYLRLLNAQPYLDAGYKPVLLHKCVRNRAYRQKGGDERWCVRSKGWHIRGSQQTLRLSALPLSGSADAQHLVEVTGDTNFVNGGEYSANAIDFVKPHAPKGESEHTDDIVVSWGRRTMRVFDAKGGDNDEPILHSPIRFKFGIAFQKDSNYDKTERNLPMSEIVSNIATFSVEFNDWAYANYDFENYSKRKAATVAKYYIFEY